MNPADAWKNFRLGEEISVSGTFIYNGLRRYHEMRKLDFTDELFEFLYNLSVGLERLLKIAVILFEHSDATDQEELEKSLITHSHLDLLARLRKNTEVTLGSPQIDLLSLLGRFYKSLRYDRFLLASVYDPKKEREAICSLLSKHLDVDLSDSPPLIGTENTDRYRKFIHRTVLKIAQTVYRVIKGRARAINLYTYEMRHASKAESVFLREVKISDEDMLWKELLIFFMNTPSTSGYLEFLRGIEPLDFDPARTDDYLDCFQSDGAKALIMDELEHLYSELEGRVGDRLGLMSLIGSPNVNFDSPDDGGGGEEVSDV